jgi:hypothetical protein
MARKNGTRPPNSTVITQAVDDDEFDVQVQLVAAAKNAPLASEEGATHRPSRPHRSGPTETRVGFTSALIEALTTFKDRLSAPGEVAINLDPIPPSKNEALAWVNAVDRGKPVPWTIDYCDGTPPVRVMLPVPGPVRPRRPRGRQPHWLSLERYQQLVAEYRPLKLDEISERECAKRIMAILGIPSDAPATDRVTKYIIGKHRKAPEVARRKRSSRKFMTGKPTV